MVTALIISVIAVVALAMVAVGLFVALRGARAEVVRLESRVVDVEERERVCGDELNTLRAKVLTDEDSAQREAMREKYMGEQFKNLANEILATQTRQFKETNRESIENLLKPFRENISDFRRRVETIYGEESEQRGKLKSELDRLMELNYKITTETNNLTSALRGNSKVQGDWGEMILETILDSSNLVKGTHYSTQSNFKDDEGNNLRPDVVLRLPEGKSIVIDSKCSLTAFVNYANSEDVAQRKGFMESHIVSVRQHIKELTAKNYQDLVANSPDFVIMFIPSEPAFLAALQGDSALWSEAYAKRVIISSPTNLFALLKLVDDLWKRDAQDKNSAAIAQRGTKLYEQLVNFTATLEGVGSALDTARTRYDDAYKKLCTGKGNIVSSGEKLRKLGLQTKKQQSAKVLVDSELDGDEMD